jgi:hypothetical protein
MTSPIESDHIYLQINSDAEHRFIPRDLQIFEAKKSFWIVDPKKNRGINCRWGARGIIAETHYDGGRNFVAMLRGAKRYLLLPPSDCLNIYLYPRGHPEGRHARADWSKLDLEKWLVSHGVHAVCMRLQCSGSGVGLGDTVLPAAVRGS